MEATLLLSSGKGLPKMVDPLDRGILRHWAPLRKFIKICMWEQT